MFIKFSTFSKKIARDKFKIIKTCKYHSLYLISLILGKLTLMLWEWKVMWILDRLLLALIANNTLPALGKKDTKTPQKIANAEIKANCPSFCMMVKRQRSHTINRTHLILFWGCGRHFPHSQTFVALTQMNSHHGPCAGQSVGKAADEETNLFQHYFRDMRWIS